MAAGAKQGMSNDQDGCGMMWDFLRDETAWLQAAANPQLRPMPITLFSPADMPLVGGGPLTP